MKEHFFSDKKLSPILNERGKSVGSIFIAMDITERTKAVEALRIGHDDIHKHMDSQAEALSRSNEDLAASVH
jgi:hypothetical protein